MRVIATEEHWTTDGIDQALRSQEKVAHGNAEKLFGLARPHQEHQEQP